MTPLVTGPAGGVRGQLVGHLSTSGQPTRASLCTLRCGGCITSTDRDSGATDSVGGARIAVGGDPVCDPSDAD